MKNTKRRKFIKLTAGTIASIPVVTFSSVALSQEAEKLSVDDPTAIALGYKEDTNEVDQEKFTTHTKQQVCRGCILYLGDDLEWGGCGAFPNKLVAGQGWCQAYVAKPV